MCKKPKIISKKLSDAVFWIWIQSGQWIQIQEGKNDPQKRKS